MMRKHYLAREDGFTLVELIIVMVIFLVVVMITTSSFNTILSQTKKVTKSEESNIEGVIGLEMFRHDLEQAGFGLFTDIDSSAPPDYREAATGEAANTAYNDQPSGIPRAVVAGNNLDSTHTSVLTGTDYLAIKATTVARNQASQKWTYINGLGSSKIWGVNDFTTSDYVIVTRQSYKNGELQRKLIYDLTVPTSFSVRYRATALDYTAPFAPPSDAVQHYYYGIDGDDNPRAPFNRTDYYVKRTSETPANCAPGAGVLYKATMSQISGTTGGTMTDIPILDCVADMQVVFGWDTGNPTLTYTDADMTTMSTPASWTPSLSDPSDIRKHLKLIKVYIMAQDGGKDVKYFNKNELTPVGVDGEAKSVAGSINLSLPNYQNYRWKLYRIVVKPKNLM